VAVYWFWREIVFDVTYVLTVEYSCGVVSVFWFWREIVFGVTLTYLGCDFFSLYRYTHVRIRTSRSSFLKTASSDYFPIILCFFCLVHTQIHTNTDMQIRFV
jgi:hypothetical protein